MAYQVFTGPIIQMEQSIGNACMKIDCLLCNGIMMTNIGNIWIHTIDWSYKTYMYTIVERTLT